jgi:predicted type IV restriction endonuclease
MPAPQEVQNLIARFEDHLEVYKSGDYNEAQLRDDFLNPLFDALGWDVDNAAG